VSTKVHEVIPDSRALCCLTTKVINVTITEVIMKLRIFQEKTLMSGEISWTFPCLRAIHSNDQIFIFEMSYKYNKN
jgi:hypothetical protein